jgi:hypothetical protein
MAGVLTSLTKIVDINCKNQDRIYAILRLTAILLVQSFQFYAVALLGILGSSSEHIP